MPSPEEKGGETPNRLPTAEELSQQGADLARKVKEAKHQKEKDIHQKIADRETLIGQMAKNDELLPEARKLLDFYQQLEKVGELPEEEKDKAEEMLNLVGQLENDQEILDQRIASISGHPEIEEKLHEKALQENQVREIEAIDAEAKEQLEPKIMEVALAIKKIANDEMAYDKYLEEYKEKRHNAFGKIKELLNQALKDVGGKSQLYNWLQQFNKSDSAANIDEFRQQLTDKRKELGFFQGKEKNAIDNILSRETNFKNWAEAQTLANNQKGRLEDLQNKIGELSTQYKDIILKGWEFQNKINELSGRSNSLSIPSHLRILLEEKMKVFADFKRKDKQGMETGQYEQWYDATRDPKNSSLYDLYERIEEKAGGLSLTHNNPKDNKQET